MRKSLFILALIGALTLHSELIDRIAIIVGNEIIKDSDIARDIRLTDFLNGDQLSFSVAARKEAAKRLIDQAFIRREIRIGDYPTATLEEADADIKSIAKKKYGSQAAMDAALARYGLTEADLQMHLQWQLSVLKFVDARFKPAAYISDDEVNKYLQSHEQDLKRAHPAATDAELRSDVQSTLAGERENKLFFDWLDEQRKDAKIQFLEDSLQ